MGESVLDLLRPELRELRGYSAAAPDFDRCRLHANESPWDDDLSLECTAINRYPPVRAFELEQRLAHVYGTAPANLLVTRGSDDGIDLLVRSFCRAGLDAVLVTPPTFGMYSVAARVQHAGVVEVPLQRQRDFGLDAQAVIDACHDASIRLVFLCSPNNPTGTRLAPEAVHAVCAALAGRAVVVVDEAYAEFTRAASHISALEGFDNLIVLRTLSKAHALAGARCGAVVAHPGVIDVLGNVAQPYAMPSPIIAAAMQRLTPEALAQTDARITQLIALRESLASRLATLPWVRHVWPSDTNFLLVDVDDANGLVARLHQRNLLVRAFPDKPGLEHSVRISIGTPDQQKSLLNALECI
jgi:histidinol-phosphate aminotransferase